MNEHGFFHPDRGYWQTTGTPTQDILDAYPQGTVEVPLQPSVLHKWEGGAWVPPTAEETAAYEASQLAIIRSFMRLSFAQLLIGLVTEQWITESEGEAWLDGTLPAAVTTLISTLPPEQQFPAKARAKRPSEVMRLDPLVEALGAAQGKTAEELDTFFTTYSTV